MAKEVIKKDGTKEPFDVEKIKKAVSFAAQGANVLEERKNELVEQVTNAVLRVAGGKEEIATSEIKEKILSELDRLEPAVSAAWREYEEGKK